MSPNPDSVRNVIVYGGTFDPVHVGHLSIADQALRATGADQVWFMPARNPRLRSAPVASVADRVTMLRRAVAGRPEFVVREDEARRGDPTITYDTLRALHREHPALHLSLLLGADSARSVPRWEHAEELLGDEDFVIVNRSGVPDLRADEAARLGFAPGHVRLLRVVSPDVSASEVRRRVVAAQSLAGLVPDAVARYIAERGLYAVDARPMHNALG